MAACSHQPLCTPSNPNYCWDPRYLAELIDDIQAEDLDPVKVAAARGEGLAARVAETLAGNEDTPWTCQHLPDAVYLSIVLRLAAYSASADGHARAAAAVAEMLGWSADPATVNAYAEVEQSAWDDVAAERDRDAELHPTLCKRCAAPAEQGPAE